MRRIVPRIIAVALLCVATNWARCEDAKLVVQLDTTEVPELRPWGEAAQRLLLEWHPRISNLLPSKGFEPQRRVELRIRKSDKGVGGTSGHRIGVSSSWIEKHPDDFGMIIHELVHVIQRYPDPDPGWITEGIADYLRWAIYEGKPQAWFPAGRHEQGYQAGYRVAAGLFLWLETDVAPGIVKRLNTSMRNRAFDTMIFTDATGKSLDGLWADYVQARTET